MKNLLISFLLALLSQPIISQNIPSPSEFLGYELGTQFTRHHQAVSYFKAIASASDQVNLSSYGTTYEGRELQLAIISSSENLSKLEEIKENHLVESGLKKRKCIYFGSKKYCLAELQRTRK